MSQSFQNVNGKIRFPDEKLVPDGLQLSVILSEPIRTATQAAFMKALQDLQNEVRFPIGSIDVTSYYYDDTESPVIEGVAVNPK
jgi:hypothetical protein